METPSDPPPPPQPTTTDPVFAAIDRLRQYPEWKVIVADLRSQREERFRQLGGMSDVNEQQQCIGSIATLQDLADTFEG